MGPRAGGASPSPGREPPLGHPFVLRLSETKLGLVRRVGERIDLLQDLPGRDVRAWDWSEDGGSLAVLDLSGKRVQRFDMVDGRLERRRDPPTLAKNAFGASLVARNDLVYVGGACAFGLAP